MDATVVTFEATMANATMQYTVDFELEKLEQPIYPTHSLCNLYYLRTYLIHLFALVNFRLEKRNFDLRLSLNSQIVSLNSKVAD